MAFHLLNMLRSRALAAGLVLAECTLAAADLKYSCEELGDMAVGVGAHKAQGYQLDDVLAVIQRASAANVDKEALLSNLAIEIYVDAAIGTEQQARALARARCTH
jgi:dihydroxyacetone kinase